MKKDFKTRPTEQFLTDNNSPYSPKGIGKRLPPKLKAAGDPEKKPEKEPEKDLEEIEKTLPKGYRIMRDRKDSRLQVLLPSKINKELSDLATKKGMSKNELINTIFYEYLEREG